MESHRLIMGSKALAPLLLLLLFGPCNQGSPGLRQRGIRIRSWEVIVSQRLGLFTVNIPGVGNSGQFVIENGEPSPGSGLQKSFQGVTAGDLAISDYPEARDNAYWDLSASYLSTIPACGTVHKQFLVPSGGSEYWSRCFV